MSSSIFINMIVPFHSFWKYFVSTEYEIYSAHTIFKAYESSQHFSIIRERRNNYSIFEFREQLYLTDEIYFSSFIAIH